MGETNKQRRGKKMIQQTVLPFKLERTREEITGRSGLSLYAEFMKAMGIKSLVDKHMPAPGSGNSFEAIDYIKPLSMMLYGGGQTIEDIREIREDTGLRERLQVLKRYHPHQPLE